MSLPPVEKLFFRRIMSPRPAFLIGSQEALQRAQSLSALQHVGQSAISFGGIGLVTAQEILIGPDTVWEVAEATAAKIIALSGAELGQEGIALSFISGA